VRACEYRFWPWLRNSQTAGCEPDVVLLLEDGERRRILIGIEAKYRSGKSSRATEEGAPTDQLAREWLALRAEARSVGADRFHLVYLTADFGMPREDIDESLDELDRKCVLKRRWVPHVAHRFYATDVAPRVLLFVSVLLDDRGNEYEPMDDCLLTAGAIIRKEKGWDKDKEWKVWWARWHGFQRPRHDDGRILVSESKDWVSKTEMPRSSSASSRRACSCRPCGAPTTLKTFLDPLLREVEAYREGLVNVEHALVPMLSRCRRTSRCSGRPAVRQPRSLVAATGPSGARRRCPSPEHRAAGCSVGVATPRAKPRRGSSTSGGLISVATPQKDGLFRSPLGRWRGAAGGRRSGATAAHLALDGARRPR
jgi:hypothetical protein